MITARSLALASLLAVAMTSCAGWRGASSSSLAAPASHNDALQSPIVEAGTSFQAHLETPLAGTRVGDPLTARLDEPLVAADGTVVAPRGSALTGRVLEVTPDRVTLRFDRLHVDGLAYPMVTAVTDVYPMPKGTGGGPSAEDAPPATLSFVVARPVVLPSPSSGREVQNSGEVDRTFW